MYELIASEVEFVLLIVFTTLHFYKKWKGKVHIGISFILAGAMSFVCIEIYAGNLIIWSVSFLLLVANVILHMTPNR
ncbi:hypothetical protein [Vibrio parahaemolyticus]|uniref:hypothetical protein n=1 Tax=Vibrio parahaemolyticus TaxID=670 RepID=UPI0004702A2F|nr:hypothetical protein [Vibrio parahaemolyticus]MDF5406041.1 hypothetical protein [Vibrio parahaemolyticus]MDG2821538.1 hypothetical protein [Vibrio parahaemolyticus]MDG2844683.1 hypothetical protein [Vibrio parahaemolyticus]MDG2856831.1 hypothetical protein [Vibrio parahaemolyticus]MDG2865550.1 hypothetical protein [Vibrio parahaemolyticus]